MDKKKQAPWAFQSIKGRAIYNKLTKADWADMFATYCMRAEGRELISDEVVELAFKELALRRK